jgi:hypothetical protein
VQSTAAHPPQTRPGAEPRQLFKELIYSDPDKRGILVGPTHTAVFAAQDWVQEHARENIAAPDDAAVVSGRAAKVAWLLMDNALKHTRSNAADGCLKVELSRKGCFLTVAVTDGGPLLFTEQQSFPVPRQDDSGGLNQVARLCVDWWWDLTATGPLTVYAQIELP